MRNSEQRQHQQLKRENADAEGVEHHIYTFTVQKVRIRANTTCAHVCQPVKQKQEHIQDKISKKLFRSYLTKTGLLLLNLGIISSPPEKLH